MANTEPIVDNIATVEYIKRKANDLGLCKVLVIGALSKKSEGKEIAEIASMLEGGIVAVSDDGGCIQNAKIKLNALKYAASFGIPVIVHAEDYNLAGKGQINAGKMSTKLGLGGIPGLANMYNREMVMDRAYLETPSTDNPDKVLPQTSYQAPEGELKLPELYDTVKTLAQTVKVEYIIPGCPPEAQTTWMALEALINGQLPPVGTVITDNAKAVCDDCPRKRDVKKVKKFHRTYEIITDPEICLLEQGLPCAGIATKGGCGARCPKANMPCTGCYGPVEGVIDQGAHFMNAIASVIDSNDPDEIDKIIEDIRDPAGTFYRYSLPDSILRRARV